MRGGFFKKKDEQKIGDIVPERKVRHVEKRVSLPFINDEALHDDKRYGKAENMLDEWGLSDKDASVTFAKRNVFIKLIIAFVVTVLIIAGVFFILPRVLPEVFKGSNIQLFVQNEVNLQYEDENYAVIKKAAVSVLKSPMVDSPRVTQVLYNELITIEGKAPVNDYMLIKTSDGITGYIPEDSFTRDTSSVEPDLHSYKLIVSDPVKNVMSHANNGTLITKVMMNTVLYADVKRDGVYQVYLPDGDMGWIGSSGLIEIGTREQIGEVSSRYFVSSIMTMVNASYLENGTTMNGISVNGAVYVASAVNGIEIPRTMQEQSQVGEEVPLKYDAVTGELDIDTIIPGDLVFLRSAGSSEDSRQITEMAVCTDNGTLFMISNARTTCRLRTFAPGDSICNRIIEVRRIFKTE